MVVAERDKFAEGRCRHTSQSFGTDELIPGAKDRCATGAQMDVARSKAMGLVEHYV